MNGFIGEFLGTVVLIVLGQSVSAGANLKDSFGKTTGKNWFYITFSWGVAVTMGIYVAGSFGSLGHLNPAITVSYALFGLFSWGKVLPYLTGQILGAFLGAVIVMVYFYPQFKKTTSVESGNSISIFATMPAIENKIFNFLSEFIATFFFTLIVLNLGDFSKGLKPFIVGLVIFVIGAGLGTTTGFALNPARDLAPRFAYTIFPLPNKSSAHWEYAWVPLFGPILGAISAVGLQCSIK